MASGAQQHREGRPLPGGGRDTWVVMLSGSRWASARHRQQALAREVAEDRRVLYVDPPVRTVRWRFTVQQVGPSLWHARPPTLLPFGTQVPPANVINRWAAARSLRRFLRDQPAPRLLWIGEALAASMAGRLGERGIAYDVADLDWTFTRTWNRWHLRRGERRATKRADLMLLSSPALTSWLSRPVGAREPIVVPNACDPEMFRPDGSVPSWLQRLPSPRLVYTGSVDTRAFDAALVAQIAREHPEWTFVLVGPSSVAGRAPLASLANVRLVGKVPYHEVPGLLRGCDVCLVPYRVRGLVDYVLPKKLYEYLAVGKPVVATALPALRGLEDLVCIAHDPSEFAAGIEKALAQATSSAQVFAQVSVRRAAALANSWSARGETVRQLLTDLEAGLHNDDTSGRPGAARIASGSEAR